MAGHLLRLFVILSLATALLFNLTSLLAIKGNQALIQTPMLREIAAHLSLPILVKGIGTDIPYLSQTVQAAARQEPVSFTDDLIRTMTGLTPGNPLSIMGKEIPGLIAYESQNQPVNGDSMAPEWKVESAAPVEKPAQPVGGGDTNTQETSSQTEEKPKPVDHSGQSKSKQVLVYHTHNRESWLSVAKPAPGTSAVDHKTQNITLVGKHLAEALNDRGIGTQFLDQDIYQELIDLGKSYPFAYAQSLKAVTAAAGENRQLHYFLDLHRDDSPREKTTVAIGGKTYARLMFVIGTRNPAYEKNLKVANDLRELLDKKYPGLTRGVDDKGENEGNGEYNQHISPGSLLLEVGGTGNTIEECYRTVEAFADVFAEYVLHAERV